MFSGNPGRTAPTGRVSGAARPAGGERQVAIMALHIRGLADRPRRPRRHRGPPRGARSRAIAGSVSETITSYSYIADREWKSRGRRSPCSDWTRAATWPIVAALQRRARGARSRLSSRSRSSAGGRALTPSSTDERMELLARPTIRTRCALRRRQLQGDVEALLARARGRRSRSRRRPVAAEAALAARIRALAAAALAAEFETVTRGKASMYRSESVAGDPRRAAAGRPEVADDILVGRSDPVTMRDELFVETAAALVARPGGRAAVWADLERRWHMTTADVFEEGGCAVALDARRATPPRRREALRSCSPRSGCPG